METSEQNSLQNSSETPIKISIIALAFALVIQGAAPIFMKLSEVEVSPNVIIFHRAWMAVVCMLIWDGSRVTFFKVRASDDNFSDQEKPAPYSLDTIGWLFLLSAVFTVSQVLWAWSLTQTRIASSVLTYGLTPIFATLGEWIFLRKSFNAKYFLGMTIAIIGLGIVALSDWQFSSEQLQGDAIAMMGTICFSAYLLITPQLRDTWTAKSVFFWRCAMTIILLLPIVFILQDHILPISTFGWLSLLGLTATAFAQLLIIYSLKALSPGFVAICLLLDPFLASIVARLIFSELIGVSTWIAFLIVSFGVYLCTANTSEKAELADSR